MAERNGDLHKGHRSRMKEQFNENGLDAMNDHQALELLLFYAVPRGDTNELAHRLLNECGGNLCDVFEADRRKLLSIKGVSEHTATFLKLLPQIMSRYKTSMSCRDCAPILDGAEELSKYFEGVFFGATKEEIHAASVSDDMRLVREKKIGEGSFSTVNCSPSELYEFAKDCKCTRIVIAHNHPKGSFIASQQDIFVTQELVYTIRLFDVEVVDHIIVGNGGSLSLRSSHYAGAIWKNC